ncbi:hypothetical protein BDW75DRAFT_222256 [Aspergillus navahoensis]
MADITHAIRNAFVILVAASALGLSGRFFQWCVAISSLPFLLCTVSYCPRLKRRHKLY